MNFEIRAFYTRGVGYVSKLDEECSTPVQEISDNLAKMMFDVCEAQGMRRHETDTQIFYDNIIDSNHTTEYIFYK